MEQIIKFQLPLQVIEPKKVFALAVSKDNTFRSFVDLNSDKEMFSDVCKNENKTYCRCEVSGDKIINILEKISAEEAGF